MLNSRTIHRPAIPWMLITLGILVTLVRRLWQRPRATMLAFGLMGFGVYGLWQDYGVPSDWLEARGHVLGADESQAHNPFRNVIIRFTDRDGQRHDILDGSAQIYLDLGPEAARNVPILYDPGRPRIAMVPYEGRWWASARYILGGLAVLLFAIFWPRRRRRT